MTRAWRVLSVLLCLILGGPALAHPAEGLSATRDALKAARAALDAEDVATAQTRIDALAAQLPADSAALEYLQGRLAFVQGRYADAVSLLAKAGAEDHPGSYLRLAKDTLAAVKDHGTESSAHFVFSYPKGKDALLAPWALETLEAQREALLRDFGYAPPGKVRVEVVEDAAQLAKLSTLTLEQIQTTGTIAICKFDKLIITSPKAVLRGYDWRNTLAHEYTHLVVTQLGKNRVPIWLQEGFAKYLESSWRGPPGMDLPPASRALLGVRVRANKLVTFKQMYPSMAMLPSAEDAETAFAEVFFAMDFIYRHAGPKGLRTIVVSMAHGKSDQEAVGLALGMSFPAFEKAWRKDLSHQPYPKALIPLSAARPVLKKTGAAKEDRPKKGNEISFSEFANVKDVRARRFAHLGELMRERDRNGAASQEYGKAHAIVGDVYESISNKYALALIASHQLDSAERVLKAALRFHPGSAETHVHLGRVFLARGDFNSAKQAYLRALGEDPFDPEIHFALLDVARHLGDAPLAARARKAAIQLSGMPGKEVDAIAAGMMRVAPTAPLMGRLYGADPHPPHPRVSRADGGTR